MRNSERRQLIKELLRQWLDRRVRYIERYPEMSTGGRISMRLEVERDFRRVEQNEIDLECFMNGWMVKLRVLTIPYGREWCDQDLGMLQEIVSLWFAESVHMDDPDWHVFDGTPDQLTDVYNRVMALGVPHLIVPNTAAYDHSNAADWCVAITGEGYDLYRAKYDRHAA